MAAVAGGPPGVIVPLTSGGTSNSLNVPEPVAGPGGSTTIAYVPVAGSVRTSMNAVKPGPKNVLPPTGLPSGPTIDAVADEKLTELIVALTRWPAVPLKVNRPFCPGTVVVIVTLGPPGAMAPPASGG